MRRAFDAAVERMLAEKPPAEQNRIRSLPPAQQRREREELLAEWRMRETILFSRKFDNQRLVKFLQLPPEARRRHVQERVRWFQLAQLLHADGVSPDSMRLLGQLRADDRAMVALAYEQAREISPLERRARMEAKIAELHGARSLDPERGRRPFPRLREMLQRERRGDDLPLGPRPPR
jgi:hypothetical protein